MVADNAQPFETLSLESFLEQFRVEDRVAVGVSGGPDSMALTRMLCELGGPEVHALTVDHGLRQGSDEEALNVKTVVSDWPNIKHTILRWEGEKPQSRVMEVARAERYRLIENYCESHSIQYLFLAHHQDDQAETFLFRLSKGSGLDGLAAMPFMQSHKGGEQDVVIVRPLLECSKSSLEAFCKDHAISYVVDPSNHNDKYARPRLRKSQEILAAEGLTAKRIGQTAKRIRRAREALEHISHSVYQDLLSSGAESGAGRDKQLSFNLESLLHQPYDIMLRVILRAMRLIEPSGDYGPRLEKVEHLQDRMIKAYQQRKPFRETLGGCIITLDYKEAVLSLQKEQTEKE